ncbi:MAG: hypothetical protein ACM37W_04105 [Actinomycetota bacterium]
MPIVQHLWELVLWLVIITGPLPLCLCLVFIHQTQSDHRSFSHYLLIALTGWSVLEVCLGLILGSLQSLTLNRVAIWEIVLFILGLILFLALKQFSTRFSFQELFKIQPSLKRIELLILGSLAFMGAVTLEKIATEPMTNYDSLWFQLPAIARWYQTGSLTLLDPAGHWIFEHPDAKLYPYNWHIISTLFILPFREDFLVAFPQVVAWVLLGLAIYLMSLHLGSTRLNAMAGASLVLTVPMLLNSVNSMQVDLPLAAFFTIPLYLAFSYHRTRSLVELGLCLASLGMLAGIKTPGIIYAALLVTVFIILELKSIWLDKNQGFKLTYLLNPLVFLGILSLFLLGTFWYIRDWIEVKNYIAEISEIKVASANLGSINSGIFSKLQNFQKSTLTSQFNPANLAHWKTLGFQIIARLQIPFIALLAQALLLPFAFINRQNIVPKKQLIITLSLLIITWFLYWNTPYSSGTMGEIQGEINPLLGFNFRYGFPFLSVLGIGAAVSATALRNSPYLTVAFVIISSISGRLSSEGFDKFRYSSLTGEQVLWGSGLIESFKNEPDQAFMKLYQVLGNQITDLMMGTTVFLGWVAILSWVLLASMNHPEILETLQKKLQPFSRGICIFICILLFSASWVARENRDLNRTKFYRGIYEYIETTTKPHEKIAYFSSPRNYLFYGKHLDRQVLCVPLKINKTNDWLDELQRKAVNLVAIGPTKSETVPLKQALPSLIGLGKPLRPIFGRDVENESVLYRVVRESK